MRLYNDAMTDMKAAQDLAERMLDKDALRKALINYFYCAINGSEFAQIVDNIAEDISADLDAELNAIRRGRL